MRLRRIMIMVAAVFALIAGTQLHAGDFDLRAGAFARVAVPNAWGVHWVQGEVVSIERDELTLQTKGAELPVVVPLAGVSEIEIRQQQGNRGRAALIGAGSGVLAGVVCGRAIGTDPNDPHAWGLSKGHTSSILATVFGTIGLIAGSRVGHGSRWHSIPVENGRIDIAAEFGSETRFYAVFEF